MKQTLQIPFGIKGFHEIVESKGTIQGFILDGIVSHLEEQEYSESQIGRMIFEEALDWQARMIAGVVAEHMKKRKEETGKRVVPKYIPVELKIKESEYIE